MNPQIYGYFLEKALAAGALDVYTTPVQMKKNRPGYFAHASVQACKTRNHSHRSFSRKPLLSACALIKLSGAYSAARIRQRHTAFGDVRIKLSRINGRILHVAPEYDDCRKLAVEKNVPLQHVISDASAPTRRSS